MHYGETFVVSNLEKGGVVELLEKEKEKEVQDRTLLALTGPSSGLSPVGPAEQGHSLGGLGPDAWLLCFDGGRRGLAGSSSA